jgi:hypothetical protein
MKDIKRNETMSRLEKEIERAAIRIIQEHVDCKILKTSESLRHFPDRMILLPGGRVVWVEFKRKKEKLRPGQSIVSAELRRLGFEVYVIDDENSEEFAKLLANL